MTIKKIIIIILKQLKPKKESKKIISEVYLGKNLEIVN